MLTIDVGNVGTWRIRADEEDEDDVEDDDETDDDAGHIWPSMCPPSDIPITGA
jgi:hypothetical protein